MLRYMAILAAARDFGVPQDEIDRAARAVDPHTVAPHTLANVLVDALIHRRAQV